MLSQWRTTYQPGEWIVLAGPTSLVVIQPLAAEWASLLSDLWEEVLGSSSLPTLVDQLVAERKITRAVGNCLKATVTVAQKLIAKGNNRAARTVLKALVSEIDFLVRIRMMRAADVAPLRALLISTYQSLR